MDDSSVVSSLKSSFLAHFFLLNLGFLKPTEAVRDMLRQKKSRNFIFDIL